MTALVARPSVLALLSAACFALALVLTQRGLRHRTPLAGAIISVPTTALLFWLLAPLVLRVEGWRSDAAVAFAAVGLLFPAAVTLLTFEANRRLGPNVAGAVGNLAPLFAVLVAMVALAEVPGAMRLLGVAVVVAGVTLLALRRAHGGARPSAATLGLPLLAAAIRGATQPAVKAGLALWPSPFAAGLIGYTVSAVVILVTAGYLARRNGVWRNAGGRGWFVAVGLCNGAAVLLMYAALGRGPVALVSPIVASYPLFTLLFARLLLPGERAGGAVVAGVAITVAGVVLLLAG
ncbi:MAG: DMT family transporter [Alphaproteobacteria bacterium]|nr:DMT family transporter [Alphaproteobacteria bacterium]